MTPGEKTKQFIVSQVKKLPASARDDDVSKWLRSILGALLILTGIVILVLMGIHQEKVESWTQILPGAIPLAAGLFLFDPKHVLDAVKAGKK